MNEAKRLKSFTLAEILITLMVIGVLAIITIPALIQSWEERANISKLIETYSILQQAYKMVENEYGPYKDYTSWPNVGYYSPLGPLISHLRIIKNCESYTQGCSSNDYKYLDGSDPYYSGERGYEKLAIWYKFILINGASINVVLQNSGIQLACNNYYSLGKIDVDVNGAQKKPNIWGKDMFTFCLTEYGIIPTKSEGSCKLYGDRCSGYVIENHNMNYLKK